MEKGKDTCLKYKEVTDIDKVNRMIRDGWKLQNVSKNFGTYIFIMIRD